MRRLLPVLLTLALAVLGLPLTASAHSQLISSSPAAGEKLDQAPTEVVLTFSEEIQAGLSQVTVTDGEGLPMTDGKPVADGATLTQPLGQLHPGPYTITYKVVSADGHPISDAITFTVTEKATSTASSTSSSSSTTSSTTSTTTSTTPEATMTTSATTTPATTEDDGSGGAGMALVVGLGVLLIAGLGWGLRGRRGADQARHR